MQQHRMTTAVLFQDAAAANGHGPQMTLINGALPKLNADANLEAKATVQLRTTISVGIVPPLKMTIARSSQDAAAASGLGQETILIFGLAILPSVDANLAVLTTPMMTHKILILTPMEAPVRPIQTMNVLM